MREEDLYPPVKAFLEGQGYVVKGEIGACDVVARRASDPIVIVELKLTLGLTLVLQGVARLKLTDAVYLALPRTRNGKSVLGRRRRDVAALCRRLGLGLMTVDVEEGAAAFDSPTRVEILLDPAPYAPKRSKRRESLLLKEFDHRVGDPNRGGSRTRPRVTAYRQDALRIARHLSIADRASPRALRDNTGVRRAAPILQRDVYGWFLRVERGVYALSIKGKQALDTYADVIARLAEDEARDP
jgi:hypothetical protein